jgi:hypothetical protein
MLPTELRLFRHNPGAGDPWPEITDGLSSDSLKLEATARREDAQLLVVALVNPSPYAQVWLRIPGPSLRYMFVAVLPPPPPLESRDAESVRVVIRRNDTGVRDSGPFTAAVEVKNPQAAAVLGFLVQGQFGAARLAGSGLLDHAE